MDGFYADGAPRPPQGGYRAPTESMNTGSGVTDRAAEKMSKVSRILSLEGKRGYATRSSIYVRHLAYLLTVLVCCGLTQAFTAGVGRADGGGVFMLLACATIVVTGAVATLFYANLRREIVEKVRHYVFGLTLLPSTLVAGFLSAAQNWFGADTFSTTLSNALPVVFLASVLIPAFVFVKEIVGIRTLYRSRLDDEEAVRLYTRQDGMQR
jgi:hypothetical protein